MPLISYTEKAGPPLQVHSKKITPLHRVLQISPPGLPGGLIWNRPVGLLVEDEQGSQHRIPVTDVTRWVIWGFLGAGLAFALLALFRQRRNK